MSLVVSIPAQYMDLIERAIGAFAYAPCNWEYYPDEMESCEEHVYYCYGFNCALDYCCIDDRPYKNGYPSAPLTTADFYKHAKRHYNGDWAAFAVDIENALTDYSIQTSDDHTC